MSRKQKKRTQLEPLRPPDGRPPSLLRSRLLHIAILAAVTFAIYANALEGGFVFDDHTQLVRNETIRSLARLPDAFTSPLWSFLDKDNTGNNRYYRPMQPVIYAVVYHFAELSPFAYHFASLLLHIGACIVVYLLCIELEWTATASFLAALLFSVHPVHTEAVSWVAGVTEVACGLFYFAALLALLRGFRPKGIAWIPAGMLFLLAALFSKEMAVTFPVAALLLLLMQWVKLQLTPGKAVLALAPYVLVLLFYAIVRIQVVGASVPATFVGQASLIDWATFGMWIFGRYLRYAFLPYPLTAMTLTPLYLQDRILSTLAYGLAIAGTIVLLALLRRRIREGLYWFAIFSAMLAPAFYFKGITGGFVFAERYLYIATFPAVALAASFLLLLPPRKSTALSVVVIVACSIVVIVRNPDWRSDETVYLRSVEAGPENVYAWLGLAVASTNMGKDAQARHAFEMAKRHLGDTRFIKLPDSEYRVELGLGTLAARDGRPEEAKTHLQRAIEVNPSGENAYTILAGVYLNFDRNPRAAIPLLEKAIARNPVDDQARDSMGVALYNLGRFDEAAMFFQEALRINPQSTLAQQHLQRVMQHIRR